MAQGKSKNSRDNRTARLQALHERMLLIRQVETRLGELFADDEIPGFIHLSIGQEATATGVGSVLGTDDTIGSTHRGHGHALAKGMDLEGFFLELFGKADGICAGRGGSMHVADFDIGMLGANGIVGAGLPIALGSALAHRVKGSKSLSVSFFGDGAMAEGVLHETLNLARIWSLPLLFVCENNGWGEFSPSDRMLGTTPMKLAAAFDIAAKSVDGNDVEAVADAAERLSDEIRAGKGPRLLECKTTRVMGHFAGDPQKYRDPDEIKALAKKDPIARAERKLRRAGVSAGMLMEMNERVAAAVEAAIEIARKAKDSDFTSAAAAVYAGGA
jgi:TPP-dependent pyruvate/acetoin dehydrogenase alpha subunit